jgi:YMGG-like Gly-zipper
MRGQVLAVVTALSAFTAFAQPAAADPGRSYHDQHVANQQQCQRARNNNTVAGAVIGGIAGAVLGSNAAARGHRSDGTAVGAAVGAFTGGAIGRSSTRCNEVPQGGYDPYYGDRDGYYGDDSGLAGGPYRQSGYGRDYGYEECRPGEVITRDPYGREYSEDVLMCRGADGVWRPRE